MKINLQSLDYSEYEGDLNKNLWSLKGLCLNEFNLIVGKNSTGKSRITRVIYGLGNMISRKNPPTDGHFKVNFEIIEDGKKKTLFYELNVVDKKVIKEIIEFEGKPVLNRNSKTTLFSYKTNAEIEIDPPIDALV